MGSENFRVTIKRILLPSFRIFLGCLLLISSVSKFISFSSFIATVQTIFPLSQFVSTLVAIGVISIELVVAFSFVLGIFLKYSSIAATLLFILFTLVMANQLFLGKAPDDCGCFGTLISSPVDTTFFLRNGIFIIISIMVFSHEGRKDVK